MAKDWRDQLATETRSAPLWAASRAAHAPPGLTVLAHPDMDRVGERATLAALLSGSGAGLSRLEPLFAPVHGGTPRPLADPYISRRPVLLAPTPDGLRLDASATTTSLTVRGVPDVRIRAVEADDLRRGVVLMLSSRVVLLLHRLEPVLVPTESFGIVGASANILRLQQDILRVAQTTEPVLVRGATGTGKELVARALHQAGPRHGHPLVAVNMGGLVPSLAQAALFGAERGAFTGADRPRRGYFREADGGTLFLDEIGAAPGEVQLLLLRALEEQCIRPVGSSKDQPIDVRVVAATDTDLAGAIATGAFHSPLYYRLSHAVVDLPPLRARREDLGRLLVHFLHRSLADASTLQRDPPWLPAELIERLARASWPGNVRQLRNFAHQLATNYQNEATVPFDRRIEGLLAEASAAPTSGRGEPQPPAGPSQEENGRDFSEDDVRAALREGRYVVAAAARQLGVPRSTLYDLMRRYHIKTAADLDAREIEEAAKPAGGKLPVVAERLGVSQKGLVERIRKLGLGHLFSPA